MALCESHGTYVLNLVVLITALNPSICITSTIRVITIKNVDYSDITYNNILDDICSSLEPTFGVINACLPILQPVMSKVSDSTIVAWSKWKSSGGTSRGWLRTQGTPFEPSDGYPKSRRFHRLPADPYPLTDITASQSHCSGPGHQTASDTDMEALNDELDHHTGIKVKQSVGIESKLAPQP